MTMDNVLADIRRALECELELHAVDVRITQQRTTLVFGSGVVELRVILPTYEVQPDGWLGPSPTKYTEHIQELQKRTYTLRLIVDDK